jgi:tetratricopeptide (TPR) repeat protein
MTGNQEEFQKAMDMGHSAAWDKLWDRAAGFYYQALEEFPDNTMALNSLGLALLEMQLYSEALSCYQRASKLSPGDSLPLEKIGVIYERQGKGLEAIKMYTQAAELQLKAHDVDKAIDTWKRVCILQPEHMAARSRLAMIYDRIGRKSEAVREYLATAYLLQKSGDIAKAMQIVEYCLQIMPGSNEARQALGMLRSNQLLPRPTRPPAGTAPLNAVETYRLEPPTTIAEAQLDPIGEARQKALTHLADLLFDQTEEPVPEGQVNRRGVGQISRGSVGVPTEHADRTRIILHLGQAIESQMKGADVQAAEDLERSVELGLNDPAAFFDLGLLYSQRDAQKSVWYLQKVIKTSDYSLGCRLLLGQIRYEGGAFPEAVNYYLQALCLADTETVPSSQADELRQLYEPIIETQGRSKESAKLKAICETISKQINRPDWRQYLMTARQQMPSQPEGNPPLPLAEMLLEISSNQVVEALAHIHQLASQNKYLTAMEEIYYALQYAPTYLPLHIQIGDLLMQEGRIQDAVEKYMLIAELYGLRGETTQAIRLLERVLRLAPMDLLVRSRLIELLISQDRVDEAIQQYLDLADIYYHLAELDMARQTYVSALRIVQKSRKGRTWAVDILYKVADIDMQRLELRQAIRIFEQIRTMEPEDITARAHLVDLNYRLGQDGTAMTEADGFATLLENTGKRAEAIQFLGGLLQDHSDRPGLRKRLADAYVRDGQTIAAVEQIDKLADELLSAGDKDGAVSMLQLIITLNPPNVAEYRTALARMEVG